MSEQRPLEQAFLDQVVAIVEENIANEQFGVTELADKMNMSRSNLLIRVKRAGQVPVNQLIKEIRLKKAMDLLRNSTFNVSEISHRVGFSSPSYFIKCFREHYGYPPGEAGKRENHDMLPPAQRQSNRHKRMAFIAVATLLIVATTAGVIVLTRPKPVTLEKSVGVLPFKNDSSDSSNLYLINGLMEATLINLQKIENLRVISRTSTEKYRNAALSIPEMSDELQVNYFVEGSGQKIGDQILLNIQLIEGPTDKHLWGRQYRREARDIFTLQEEIAQDIAKEIKVIITPEEASRIKKKPTDNLEAYDYYLKAIHFMDKGTFDDAITWFEKAITQDKKFALAYAGEAVCYYYKDVYQVNKQFGDKINYYSDQALLYDPTNYACLVTRGMYYIHQNIPEQAVPYLEKALENNPNSVQALNALSDIYNVYIPNTALHLEYALQAARLDINVRDSAAASHNYMHLAAAFIQAGFKEEAFTCVNRSLAYNPRNMFAPWVKAAIVMTMDRNVEGAIKILQEDLMRDSTRFHVIQELGKLYYLNGNLDGAYKEYRKFVAIRDMLHLDIFRNADLMVAVVYEKKGLKKEAERFVSSYKDFAEHDKTIYKDLHLYGYYRYMDDNKKALDHLEAFSKKDNYQYWALFIDIDPDLGDQRNDPRFKKLLNDITTKFWANHERIKMRLEEKGLLNLK